MHKRHEVGSQSGIKAQRELNRRTQGYMSIQESAARPVTEF